MIDNKISEAFVVATQKVLSSFAGMQIKAGEAQEQDKLKYFDISATVSLMGEKEGFLLFSFTLPCVIVIAETLLGDDMGDPEDEAKDVLGELTNIICGQVRASLEQENIIIKASTPSVGIGMVLSIPSSAKIRTVCIPFTTDHGDFYLEYFLT